MEDFKDDYSSHSIDAIQRRPNKKLEIIIEENNSFHQDTNNPEIQESRTQANFFNQESPLYGSRRRRRYNSSEKRKRSEALHEKVKQILEFKHKFNTVDPDEDSEEKESKNGEVEGRKKKVQKKVNRNLKLLNLIKERMNKNEENKDKNSEENNENVNNNNIVQKNDDIINNNENNKDNNNENNKDSNNENNNENKANEENNIEDKNKDKSKDNEIEKFPPINEKNKNEEINEMPNDDLKNNEEKRKQKLLKIFDKKFNKIEKEVPKEEPKKEKLEEKNKKEYPIAGAVSYPTFAKRPLGNYNISTPKLKRENSKKKSEEKESIENPQKNSSSKKEEKFSEIPIDQKDKLTINLSLRDIPPFTDEYTNNNSSQNNKKSGSNPNNEIIYLSNKKEDDNNDVKDNNNKENEEFLCETNKKDNENDEPNNNIDQKKDNNNSSSKKGALQILELLKANRKKEKNENFRPKSQDRRILKDQSEDNEKKEENYLPNRRGKDSDNSFKMNQKRTEGSKGKNNRNNIDVKFDANNLPKKTFRDEEDDTDNNYNDSYNRTQQQFRSNRKMNYNRADSNNNVLNRKRNYISNINNINNNINNFFNYNNPENYQDRKTINYINNANALRNKYNKKLKSYNSINESGRISPKSYLDPKRSMIKNNMKNLDKSFDISSHSRKNPLSRRFYNDYNSINDNSRRNVYEPKRIISNNNSPLRYDPYGINPANNLNSMKNIRTGRVYNKPNKAYIKKSPLRMKELNNSNYNIHKNANYNRNTKRNIYNIQKKNNNDELYQNSGKRHLVNNNNNNNYINTNVNNNMGSFEVSSIHGLNSSTDTYTTNRMDYLNTNYNNYYNKSNKSNISNKENSILFNLEDLMVLEEKLNDVNYALETNKNIEKQCFIFWNYYYNCSLYQILEKIFPNEEDSNIVRLSIKYELISIIICYEFSYNMDLSDEDICLSLLELIYLNHNNLMIICEYILTKIAPENKDNIWALKLQYIVNNSKISQIKEIQSNYLLTPINKIKNYTNQLIQKIKIILRDYDSEFSNVLNNFLTKIESKSYEEINDFFRLNILRENNFEGSIVASSYLKKKKYYKPISAPYIREPSMKPFTLILDLDETIISFKIKSNKEGILRARPFLFGFLEEMSHYYELIVWTSATEAYANSLIDAIEFEKKYFDYVFYREHAIIMGEDFVKDLTRVGRNLDRIIIVDDMPQNFRLQKKNGITIKPFLGDDFNDTALYDLLPILKHIAEDKKDVRIGLQKYRDEIVKKVTSNISKHNI